jgi:hypothetical protein
LSDHDAFETDPDTVDARVEELVDAFCGVFAGT